MKRIQGPARVRGCIGVPWATSVRQTFAVTLSSSIILRERAVNQINYLGVLRLVAVCAVALSIAACGQRDQPASDTVTAGAKVPVTTSSDEARELFMQGRALFDDLHFVEAHDVFVQVVEADSEFASGYLMLATTALTAAEFFEAVAKADEFAGSASEGEQLYIRAIVAAAELDQDAQREVLGELITLYPQDERTHAQLAIFLFAQQDFAGAVEHYKHALAINPDYASAQNLIGYTYRSLEDFDNAKIAFERYVELIPDEANPYDSYAEFLMEMGNYDDSIESYRKALKIDSYFSASYAGISVNESLRGDAEMAQEAADQMLAAARNFTERQGAMFRSVTSHLFAGNTEAAMDISAVMLAEAEVQGNYAAMGGVVEYMGDIMLAAGDAVQAEHYYNAALDHRLVAGFSEANQAQAERAHMFKTAICAMLGDDAEAAATRTAEYIAAAEMNGTAFERRRIHELSGFLAMSNEENESAVAHFAQASQLNPIVLYWSAAVHAELGNTEMAVDLATRAANRNTLSGNLPFFRQNALRLVAKLQSE